MSIVYYTLHNGVTIPSLGFGTYKLQDTEQARDCVAYALRAGYRSIDTAALYKNETGVGQGIRESGLKREDIFVTTKLPNDRHGYDEALRTFDESMARLGLDYLDLYLNHQPVADSIGAWRAMEEAYRAGTLRAIGVCNFNAARLLDFCESVEVKPAVDQVEMHPFFHQRETVAVMMQYNVAPEAWGPFAEGKLGIFTNPVLTEIGQAHGKTAAQVALRWFRLRGVVVIPKSIHRERMEQNLNIWDFTLTGDEMARIGALDLGHSKIVDHNDPRFIKMLHDLKVHA